MASWKSYLEENQERYVEELLAFLHILYGRLGDARAAAHRALESGSEVDAH